MAKKPRAGRKPLMTKAEARAFKKRWAAVNAFQIEEWRRESPAEKFRQLAALMSSAQAFGWSDALRAQDADVWERWNLLRKKYRG